MPPGHLNFCVNNPNLKADFENNFPKSRTAVQKKILPKKYEHPTYKHQVFWDFLGRYNEGGVNVDIIVITTFF